MERIGIVLLIRMVNGQNITARVNLNWEYGTKMLVPGNYLHIPCCSVIDGNHNIILIPKKVGFHPRLFHLKMRERGVE